jgi:hypothetical protein
MEYGGGGYDYDDLPDVPGSCKAFLAKGLMNIDSDPSI